MENKKPQVSATYDDVYKSHGLEGPYGLPYKHSCYYPLYKAVNRQIRLQSSKSILEVGCGTGGFAHCLLDRTQIGYRGFDFSQVAVTAARKRLQVFKGEDLFFTGDAKEPKSYDGDYDTIVCTEVLEHLEEDLKIIELWPSGTYCICSVPNFDSSYHVRHFVDEKEVISRYSGLLSISNVQRLKKPILENISYANWLRELRWARYKPRRIRELMGFGNFEKVGGWFIFSGFRK